MDTPRCVIFDFGNVIVFFDKGRVWTDLSTLTEGRVTSEGVQELIVDDGLEELYDRGQIDSNEFVSQICQKLKLGEESKADVKRIWQSVFTSLNTAVFDLVGGIRKRGECRLVLASNTNELHYEKVVSQFPDVLRLFDSVVLSFEKRTRSVKPERAFFERCFEEAQCDSAQCVFIDDIQLYCDTACLDFGVEAVCYNRNLELGSIFEHVGVYTDLDFHPPKTDYLLHVYQQRFLHYRHLDSLRWQVPLLVVALGGGILSFSQHQSDKDLSSQPGLALPLLLCAYGVFAGLCWYYLGRISRHHEVNTAALQWASRRLQDWMIPTSTTARCPIRSAAFWFRWFTLVISGAFVA